MHHPIARCCPGFSVGAAVSAYELHNADRRDFYAEVSSAEISEISLTDRPSNPAALVTDRYPPCAAAECYSLLGQKIKVLTQLIHLTQEARAT